MLKKIVSKLMVGFIVSGVYAGLCSKQVFANVVSNENERIVERQIRAVVPNEWNSISYITTANPSEKYLIKALEQSEGELVTGIVNEMNNVIKRDGMMLEYKVGSRIEIPLNKNLLTKVYQDYNKIDNYGEFLGEIYAEKLTFIGDDDSITMHGENLKGENPKIIIERVKPSTHVPESIKVGIQMSYRMVVKRYRSSWDFLGEVIIYKNVGSWGSSGWGKYITMLNTNVWIEELPELEVEVREDRPSFLNYGEPFTLTPYDFIKIKSYPGDKEPKVVFSIKENHDSPLFPGVNFLGNNALLILVNDGYHKEHVYAINIAVMDKLVGDIVPQRYQLGEELSTTELKKWVSQLKYENAANAIPNYSVIPTDEGVTLNMITSQIGTHTVPVKVTDIALENQPEKAPGSIGEPRTSFGYPLNLEIPIEIVRDNMLEIFNQNGHKVLGLNFAKNGDSFQVTAMSGENIKEIAAESISVDHYQGNDVGTPINQSPPTSMGVINSDTSLSNAYQNIASFEIKEGDIIKIKQNSLMNTGSVVYYHDNQPDFISDPSKIVSDEFLLYFTNGKLQPLHVNQMKLKTNQIDVPLYSTEEEMKNELLKKIELLGKNVEIEIGDYPNTSTAGIKEVNVITKEKIGEKEIFYQYKVNFNILAGTIELEAPKTLEFEKYHIQSNKIAKRKVTDWNITIEDSRAVAERTNWKLVGQMISGDEVLKNSLVFIGEDGEPTTLKESRIIHSQTKSPDPQIIHSRLSWSQNEGFLLIFPPTEKLETKKYQGTIEWQLQIGEL